MEQWRSAKWSVCGPSGSERKMVAGEIGLGTSRLESFERHVSDQIYRYTVYAQRPINIINAITALDIEWELN
jgi:hypothetical protein